MGDDYKKPFFVSRFSTRVAEILFCDFPIWNRNWIIFIRKVKKRYKFFVTTRILRNKLFDKTNFMFDFAYKKINFRALSLLLRASCGFDSRRDYQKNHIFCGFLLFLGQKNGCFWNNFQLFHYIHPKRKDKGYPQSSRYPYFLF